MIQGAQKLDKIRLAPLFCPICAPMVFKVNSHDIRQPLVEFVAASKNTQNPHNPQKPQEPQKPQKPQKPHDATRNNMLFYMRMLSGAHWCTKMDFICYMALLKPLS